MNDWLLTEDELLAECGLTALPPEEQRSLLDAFQAELNVEIGAILGQGLTTAQQNDWQSLVDCNESWVRSWLAENVPNFEDDPRYLTLKSRATPTDSQVLVLSDYARGHWLKINRPNYRQVVPVVYQQLVSELKARASELLGQ